MRTWTFLDSWNTLDSYYTLPHPEHSEWDSIFFGILYKEREIWQVLWAALFNGA